MAILTIVTPQVVESPATKRGRGKAASPPKPPQGTSARSGGRKPDVDEQSVTMLHSDYDKVDQGRKDAAARRLAGSAGLVREAAKEVEAEARQRSVGCRDDTFICIRLHFSE